MTGKYESWALETHEQVRVMKAHDRLVSRGHHKTVVLYTKCTLIIKVK